MELFLFVFGISVSQAIMQDATGESSTMEQLLKEMARMNTRLNNQQRTMQLQHQEIWTINHQLEEHANLKEELGKQAAEVTTLTELLTRQAVQVENVEARLATMEGRAVRPEYRYEEQAYGCILNVITLTCPINSYINVTHAIYGQYASACSDCCAPDEGDCHELVVENDPSDWLVLKYGCDNKTTCNYEYTGQVINDCEVAYVADYMLIYYDCLGGQERIDPVGFTAYATESRDYNDSAIFLFDGVVTNLGGHFDSSRGTFRCPYHGVYMFSVSVLSQPGGRTYGGVWLDEDYLVDTMADDDAEDTDGFSQASALVVTECGINQLVSVRATWNSQLFGNLTERHSSFSGYLLQRYG